MLVCDNFGLYVQSKSNLLIKLKNIWLCRSKNLEKEKSQVGWSPYIQEGEGLNRTFNLWCEKVLNSMLQKLFTEKWQFPQINWQFHQTNDPCQSWPKNSPVQLLVGFCFNWWLWPSLWLAQTCSPVYHHHHCCQYYHLIVVTLCMSKHGGIVLAPSSLEARSKNP